MYNIHNIEQNVNKLKLIDKCLLSQIKYLSKVNGYCFAKNDYFCELFSVSAGTIKRSLKKLEDLKLITRVCVGYGRRFIYPVCEEPKEEVKKEVKYTKRDFRFLQNLKKTKYHKAEKSEWTPENIQAANECFARWKKRIYD